MEISQHIAAVERDGELLARAAEAAGLDAAVPACPGWRVRDLVRHQAYVHRWALRHLVEQPARVIEEATEADVLGGGPPDDALIAGYRQGHAALVRALCEADPGVRCATFLDTAPTPLGFWARRQAHETAIHRFDAQSARPGGAPRPVGAFEPDFADDGIDELLMGFAARRKYRGLPASRPRPASRPEGARGQSLTVRPDDTPGRWHLRAGESGTEVSRGDRHADCVLEGPAAGLYAFLWNRCDGGTAAVRVTGDPAILSAWGAGVRVRWD
jgi:uncharacterized protein (TIGR03083 family)